jgi:5-methyltetrahydrofolate--homocysteine methyltransferase
MLKDIELRMNRFDNIIKKKILVLDGATGTNLLDKGLAPGESPSMLNINDPDEVYSLQKQYVAAGSDIILTNTFTANPMNVPKTKLDKVISAGVKIARRAARTRAMVFGDIGPLGELIEPYGEFTFDQAYDIFMNICRIMAGAGIQVFWLETFTSIVEAKAAFLAGREFSDHIHVCMSLQENGSTIMGESAETIAVTFQALGAKSIGVNCTTPEAAIHGITRMARVTDLPLTIKPNAGDIKITGNKVHHTLSDQQVARYAKRFIDAGASVIGGCCGTSPQYIKLLTEQRLAPKKRRTKRYFCIATPQRSVCINNDSHVIVGERMNPSGRKRVKKKLIEKDYHIYGEEAYAQEQAGAEALDVNAYVVDLDEKEALKHAVFQVMQASSLPLFIDTQDYKTAKAVLACYPGIGVYNSIPAQKKHLLKWLPLVKRYGFKAVISLVGNKIPRTVKQRIAHTEIALSIAQQIGFSKDDLIFDPLVFSAATDRDQIDQTLEAIAVLHRRGLKTILGISNVSFGLPGRSDLNAAFASAALRAGTTFLILNPLDQAVMNAVKSARVLFEKGFSLVEYTKSRTASNMIRSAGDLKEAIIAGDKNTSRSYAQTLIDKGIPPQKIIDEFVSKALNKVGDLYESGVYYIPDLLKAAEASKCVLDIVRKCLPRKRKQGKVVLATVRGDIHDIGKNIAAMIFESAGYEVIDLGKDIPAEKIVAAVKREKPDVLGLSALLTTTMPEMERTVKALYKAGLKVKVIIGGPNVSNSYAKKIGAYGAATNVLDGLSLLRNGK